MGIAAKVSQGAKDFRNGLSVIFGKPKAGEGDRKLAKMAAIVEGQIGIYGKSVVRRQVIKSIESDFKRTAKKSREAVDKMMLTAFDTPEYMRLLHKLGLEEPHVRVLAMEALKKYAK